MYPGTSSTTDPREGRSRRGSRRTQLCVALTAALVLPFVVAGCGSDDKEESSADSKKDVKLTVMWWGGEARAKITEQALDLYTKKHPNVTFEKTWQGNQGYYDKLATLAAGNSTPDIFQIDDNYLAEFVSKGVTLDLTKYKDSKKINVSKMPESLWKYGVVKNKFSAVAFGENTQCLAYNKTALQKAGIEEPKTGQSWEDHIAWAKKAAEATKIPGTMDPSADYKAFWIWLRGQGKDLYKDDDLGFTKDDVAKWFELWKGAREAKATPTADIIHKGNSSDITKQLVVTKEALTSWVWCNQLPELTKSTKDEIGIVAYPGDPKGQWARAASYLSGARSTKSPEIVADVINFLVNDPEVAKVLGTERGLPVNLDNRKAVEQMVTDPAMKTSIAIETELSKKFGSAPTVPLKGHSKVRSELVKAGEKVQFGQGSPAKVAEEYFAACQAAIK